MSELTFTLTREIPCQLTHSTLTSFFDQLNQARVPLDLESISETGEVKSIEVHGTIIEIDRLIKLRLTRETKDLVLGNPIKLSCSYRRKIAFFSSVVEGIDRDQISIRRPNVIHIANRRRNPRVLVEQQNGVKVMLEVQHQGSVENIHLENVYALSQLGISFRVPHEFRQVVWEGDRVVRLRVFKNDRLVMECSGVIARYETIPTDEKHLAILIFRDLNQTESKLDLSVLDSAPVSSLTTFEARHPLFPDQLVRGTAMTHPHSSLLVDFSHLTHPIPVGTIFDRVDLLDSKDSSRLKSFPFRVTNCQFEGNADELQLRLTGEIL